ncbi:cytochrome c oxidase assembly protein subunit 15 [Paucimonas lemoignei]|uniref:Cytochrome c oxidase assembly protein subunit 15 n=1 Tax=Paucimonas lemoignei TaxID=29443 RepID=A0A4R3HVB1_PAULE|nr:COX15/CtaA family protein [Paucimonas lemoignei]TCS37028.1 cytochrome c oxidase assembly protein subunit 15 [Paucimonas lemoignei]
MLIQLAIKGLLVALLALSAVWASRDDNKYRKLAWVTLFLTFDLIMFGAFTRLTDSGLGCPDWPGCYGHANPLQAHAQISEAEAAMPNGPVTVAKAWIEMIHRYLAMGVGVLIIALMAVAWRNWMRARKMQVAIPATSSPWLPSFLLAFVCLQGAFGAWTVTMKLQPVIVTIHLLLGMGLLALLAWLAARQSPHAPVDLAARSLRLPAAVALAVLFCQIALGGWVSTNYAALACSDLPTCHGVWLPEMDFNNGFTLWRHLGKTADGDFLPFPALTAIHWTHRVFALVVTAMVGWVAWRVMKVAGLRKTGTWLLAALVLQILIGVSTVYLNWPLALAVAHNGCAALLVLLLTMLNYKAGLAAVSRKVDHVSASLSAA